MVGAVPASWVSPVAIIGGSGLYTLGDALSRHPLSVATPFGPDPVELQVFATPQGKVLFLPRHGAAHSIAPHLINYRANLWALHAAGARTVVAVNAVGGISPAMTPGTLVLPDQLIDYSWGREHTFCTGTHALDKHVDFTWPFDQALAAILREAGTALGLALLPAATYASVQGPRLETAAEIRRLARDGCDIVGMTAMPEAGLARELRLRYAMLALVVNPAAGLGEGTITLQAIEATLSAGIGKIRDVLLQSLPALLAQAAGAKG